MNKITFTRYKTIEVLLRNKIYILKNTKYNSRIKDCFNRSTHRQQPNETVLKNTLFLSKSHSPLHLFSVVCCCIRIRNFQISSNFIVAVALTYHSYVCPSLSVPYLLCTIFKKKVRRLLNSFDILHNMPSLVKEAL